MYFWITCLEVETLLFSVYCFPYYVRLFKNINAFLFENLTESLYKNHV